MAKSLAGDDGICVLYLLLGAVACAFVGCAPAGPAPAAPAAPAATGWPTLVRHEGEACGGYPAPDAPLTTCAPGLRCDYGNAAMDAPGVCRPAR